MLAAFEVVPRGDARFARARCRVADLSAAALRMFGALPDRRGWSVRRRSRVASDRRIRRRTFVTAVERTRCDARDGEEEEAVSPKGRHISIVSADEARSTSR